MRSGGSGDRGAGGAGGASGSSRRAGGRAAGGVSGGTLDGISGGTSGGASDETSGNAGDSAYHTLKRWIATLTLRPGQRVSEAHIVEMMAGQVSKTPIREALHSLTREGFITRTGRFYTVAALTIGQVGDIFDLREVLELAVVDRLVASKTDRGAVRNLLVGEIEAFDAADPESIRKWLSTQDRFHLGLAELAGFTALTEALSHALERLQPALLLMLATASEAGLGASQHDYVLDAICSGDRDRSRDAMRRHVRSSRAAVIDTLSRFQSQAMMTTPISLDTIGDALSAR